MNSAAIGTASNSDSSIVIAAPVCQENSSRSLILSGHSARCESGRGAAYVLGGWCGGLFVSGTSGDRIALPTQTRSSPEQHRRSGKANPAWAFPLFGTLRRLIPDHRKKKDTGSRYARRNPGESMLESVHRFYREGPRKVDLLCPNGAPGEIDQNSLRAILTLRASRLRRSSPIARAIGRTPDLLVRS